MKTFFLIGTGMMIAGIACISFQKEKELPQINYDGTLKELPIVNNDAFKRGELLTFRMHYGMIEAGVATLGITEEAKEVAGRTTYHVVGLGESRGAFDLFYKVRDR